MIDTLTPAKGSDPTDPPVEITTHGEPTPFSAERFCKDNLGRHQAHQPREGDPGVAAQRAGEMKPGVLNLGAWIGGILCFAGVSGVPERGTGTAL